jgi:hypothetical protein
MKKIILIFLCLSSSVWAYVPDSSFLDRTQKITEKMNRAIARMSSSAQSSFVQTAWNKLTELQNTLVDTLQSADYNRLYLLEHLRRNIAGLGSFATEHTIYDELDSVIWNHAPQWFDLLYMPFETTWFEKSDIQKKYSVLINGGYFNRIDGSLYHAGLLALNGVRQTPFVPDNIQVTHTVCINAEWKISFIKNADYYESLIDSCRILFQGGPLIYSGTGLSTQANFMSNTYIGRAHKRTVMVVFEQNGKQDLWFLTINENVTLKEVRNIVLRETRFIGNYDAVNIFNLDGGSSVAHVNRAHPELNIGRTKILPIVFGIQ